MTIIPGITTITHDEGLSKARFGVWIYDGESSFAVCSMCDERIYHEPSKYCPECGAWMVNHGRASDYFRTLLNGTKGDSDKGIPARG